MCHLTKKRIPMLTVKPYFVKGTIKFMKVLIEHQFKNVKTIKLDFIGFMIGH